MTEAPTIAIALFTLKPGRTVDGYRAFSREVIRDGMAQMPSVRGFKDYAVSSAMTATDGGWQLVEVVHITSPDEFTRDNQELPGLSTAEAWNEWVDETVVLFLDEL